MPLLTPQIHEILNRETDARFSAQTGFAPGRKLDPENAIDAAMIPVWLDIFKKVKAEWARGKLVTTYDHPAVASLLNQAADAFGAAAGSVASALKSDDIATRNAHAADAVAAHAAANDATTKAATYQPPTASPQVAQHAANQIATLVATAPTPETRPAAPPVPISTHEAIDALQSSHAPAKAAATQTQTPAPDAPKAPQDDGGIGKTLLVAGSVVVAIALAAKAGNARPGFRPNRGVRMRVP